MVCLGPKSNQILRSANLATQDHYDAAEANGVGMGFTLHATLDPRRHPDPCALNLDGRSLCDSPRESPRFITGG